MIRPTLRIFHDDVRPCPPGWLLARNNAEALDLLREHRGLVNVISLDHDLGSTDVGNVMARGTSPDGDGRDLVYHMLREGLVPPGVIIHSWNRPGAIEMARMLVEARYEDVVVRPYDLRHYADALRESS